MSIDPYSANPLADWAQTGNPEHYAAIAAVADPPRMFAGGASDIPTFTASGIDPLLLLRLPYGVRHYVAAEPNMATVHSLFEQYEHTPGAVLEHEGLANARQRIQDWWANTDPNPRTEEELDAEYRQFFPSDNINTIQQARREAAAELASRNQQARTDWAAQDATSRSGPRRGLTGQG